MPEQSLSVQTLDLEKLLPAFGADGKIVAVASVCLVCVFLCDYVHKMIC